MADLDARQQAGERRSLNRRAARNGQERRGPAATKHKFRIGQLAFFYPKGARRVDSAPAPYLITMLLPVSVLFTPLALNYVKVSAVSLGGTIHRLP